MMKHRLLSDIAGATDTGLRRRANQDAMGWDTELGLALVADGVGGGNAGEVASATAVRAIKSDLRAAVRSARGGPGDPGSRPAQAAMVHELVRRANARVVGMAGRETRLEGMGTTLALVLLSEDFVTVAHVGDSRVYRMRGGSLERLTRDHFMLTELVECGALTADEAERSRHRNVLTRALGMAHSAEPDLSQHPTASGDLYLLCSDGLTTAATDEEIAGLLLEAGDDLQAAAQQAVALANRRGGLDNISVLLMRLA